MSANQTVRSTLICSTVLFSVVFVSASSGQQVRVDPGVQQPGQRQMLGVHTNFIHLGNRYFVPNRGLPSGQPAVAVSPTVGWGWDGWISTGCQISSVTHGSVAAMAGLEIGDIVLSLNGMPMTDQNALAHAVGYCQGQQVLCWVINVRNGQLTSVWCNFGGGGGWQPGPMPIPANPANNGNRK